MTNSKKAMYNYIVTTIILVLSLSAHAQIVYEFEFEASRELEPVHRIPLKPNIIDTVFARPEANTDLIPIKKDVAVEIQPIQAANIKVTSQLGKLYPGYAVLGIGNYLMPLGQFYYNETRSKQYHWGVEAKHHSAWAGKIEDFAPPRFDRTDIDLYGRLIKKTFTTTARFNYMNHGLNLFGTRDTLITQDSISQRFQNYGAYAEFASHHRDSAHLGWKVGLAYNNFRDKPRPSLDDVWRARENFIGIFSSFSYKLGQERYAADFNIQYNRYLFGENGVSLNPNTQGIEAGNAMINFHPHITHLSENNKLLARVGFNLVFDAINETRVLLSPQALIQYALLNNHLLPYVSMNGFGVQQGTFRSASNINNFVRSNLELRNERNALNFQGGLRGSITEHVSFDANFSYGRFVDKMLFVIDTTLPRLNQFRTVFDDLNISKLEMVLTFQINEKLKFDALGQLYSYQTDVLPYAWNLPNYVIQFRGHYNLFDKFITNLDLSFLGGRRMQEFGPGDDIGFTNLLYHSDMGLLADVNLSVEYRYNQRISAFIQFNNLAAQQYIRWMNSPVYRFQALGGVTFRF
jgi:hypothetical protein